MVSYSIYANGTFWGVYSGATEAEAIQSAADDVGTDGNADGLVAMAAPKDRVVGFIKSGVFHGDLCDMVREKFNCVDVDIDDEGAVWIANPQSGHWLADAETAEFADWAEKQ